MAFSDFKSIFDVANSYKTVLKKDRFFPQNLAMPFEEWFTNSLQYSIKAKKPVPSEISICESFIFPMIRYVAQKHTHIAIWSREFDLIADDRLCGKPDYLFSYTENQETISANMPLICVSEAKIDNFTNAWGQTLAEMVACAMQYPSMTIYGFASNGEMWQFAKLQNNIFMQDISSYNITTQAETIAGLLDYIFAAAVAEAEKYLGENK